METFVEVWWAVMLSLAAIGFALLIACLVYVTIKTFRDN